MRREPDSKESRVKLTDFSGEIWDFDGAVLTALEVKGYQHEGVKYNAYFSLFRMTQPERRLVAVVDLPCNIDKTTVKLVKHVLMAKSLCEIFEKLDRLDLMQHVKLPYWLGSCALLDSDLYGRRRVHISLRRGAVDFMEQCIGLGFKVSRG